MGATSNIVIFAILAAVILFSSVMAVVSRRMLRAATWLLFVLICTAGIYLMLNYHFLAAVQLSVYAGGILILFIFAILLTRPKGDEPEKHDRRKVAGGLVAGVAGAAVTLMIILKNNFLMGGGQTVVGDNEIPMKQIGMALMGTGKYQYIFPFEMLSVLLLACIIGGIIIARKR